MIGFFTRRLGLLSNVNSQDYTEAASRLDNSLWGTTPSPYSSAHNYSAGQVAPHRRVQEIRSQAKGRKKLQKKTNCSPTMTPKNEKRKESSLKNVECVSDDVNTDKGDVDQAIEREEEQPGHKSVRSSTVIKGKGKEVDHNTALTDTESIMTESTDQKKMFPAWVPLSRFNKNHPNPVIIKPVKPLVADVQRMSKSEEYAYFTDLICTLQGRIRAKNHADRDSDDLKKEIVSILEALDLVSARQEYMSLVVRMFKQESHKLNDELKDFIEARLLKINEEDRAVRIRFAKAEVKWEEICAADKERHVDEECEES